MEEPTQSSQDIRVQLAVLQTIVAQGFTGIHDRLDKLNGRVYTGEKERAELQTEVAVLKSRDEIRRDPPSNLKIAGWGAGAAAALGTLWEFIKPFVQHAPGP